MPGHTRQIAITLSPKQDMKTLKPPQVQLAKYAYPFCKLLKKYSSYYARPEMTLSGLIHYHILLTIEDDTQLVLWTRTTLQQLMKIGNTKVKPVHEATGWLKYIDKDKEVYNKIFSNVWKVPIEYTPETVKKYLKEPLIEIPLNEDINNHVKNPLDQGIKKIIKKHIIPLKDQITES
jgi:hypothetical protein